MGIFRGMLPIVTGEVIMKLISIYRCYHYDSFLKGIVIWVERQRPSQPEAT